jgi:hypothetical protein
MSENNIKAYELKEHNRCSGTSEMGGGALQLFVHYI